jgi:hypothetical protein
MIPEALKKYIDKLVQEVIKEMDGATSTTASAGGYYNSKYFVKNPSKQGDYLVKTFGYKKVKPGMPSDSKIYDYKQFPSTPKPKTFKLYKENQEQINEISYRRFSENVSKITSERKIARALQEVAKRIREIEQVVEYSNRLKTENTIKKESFWTSKTEQLSALSERLNELSNKIRNLSK